MTRAAGLAYGWHFYDTVSGKVAAGTTFRTDVSFDASVATYNPLLATFANLDLAGILIEDDTAGLGTQILLTLQRTPGPVDAIRIQSGSFDQVIVAPWSAVPTTISVIRNVLAGFYTILVNDAPILTTLVANFDGISTGANPGTTFFLMNGALDITGFKVSDVRFTASSTVYSAAWNFLHDWQALFLGSNALTRDFILTNRGPLVKDWGDMTPATRQDVEVFVNHVQVLVSEVNPYIGKITLDVPVPLLPPGDPQLDVKVDYHWMATPVMALAGLNEHGQVLNKWDRNINGFHDDGINVPRMGAPDLARFPYCVVLGPVDTPQPFMVGHRYMGFEKAYSALLNSPTTMLLNTDPNTYEVPEFEQLPAGSTASYEATVTPQTADPTWELVGIDNGIVVGDGTYQVIDNLGGSYGNPTPASYNAAKTYLVGEVVEYAVTDIFGVSTTAQYECIHTTTGNLPTDTSYWDSYTLVYSATTGYVVGQPVTYLGKRYACIKATTGNLPTDTIYWSQISCTMFKQDMDMGFPASMVLVSRYLINSATTDGIFTGVGFGFHQDKRLYLVGNLLVNAVQHVGMLKDARNPHLLASWEMGPKVTGTILTTSTVSFAMDDSYPSSFVVGNRFQILAPHSQAGVYTATHVVPQAGVPYKAYDSTVAYIVGQIVSSGGRAYACVSAATGKAPPNSSYWEMLALTDANTVIVTVTPAFPVDPKKWGNKYPDVYFETIWLESPTTYRLTMSPPPSSADPTTWHVKLALAGETSVSKVLEGDAFGTDLPQVATSSLALFTDQANPDKKIGTVVWGSLSYGAMNDTSWSFIRYGIIPNATAYRGHSKSVNTSMAVLPENEPDPAWFQTQAFGLSEANHGLLLLKSTSANASLDTTFAYGRDEPFFKKDSNIDLTATFAVETGVLGAGDCEIVLNDSTREARIATLLYYENATLNPYRQLVRMPAVSFAGLIPLADQGWVTAQAGDGIATNHENDVVFNQAINTPIRYKQSLTMTDLVPPDSGGRVIEAQFAVDEDFVPGVGGKTGIFMSGDVGGTATGGVAVTVWMNGVTPTVSLALPTGLVSVQDYPFDWTDGLQHTYRMVVSGGVVSLFVDDTLQIPTLNVALFAGQGSGLHRCIFGTYTTTGVGEIRWRSASYSVLLDATVHRTLGVYLGGDADDIDNWKIPRTDATTAKNSDQVGTVIEDMDWRTSMEVRVLRTWDWGVTVYRPDMGPPPFFTGDWATQNMQPSAGWITVEYPKLPYVPRTMGFVGFGSFDSRSVTQQRWDSVDFRIFKPITDNWVAPQHMVLNQCNVVTSGEPVLDDTLETVIIMPLSDLRRVLLKPTHIYAKDIYKVIDGLNIYTRELWTFDSEAQLLTLNVLPDGTFVYFSGQSVTILYYPGKPYTDTYLETQLLLDSMTLLNEGTPPVPKSQQNPDVQVIFTDGEYKAVTFQADPEALYENMKFMEVDNGGWSYLITTVGEGTLQPGFTGWTDAEGEVIYDENGDPTGDLVGSAIGGHVIGLKGAAYWTKVEGWSDVLQTFHMIDMGPPPVDALTLHEESLGQYLFVSGGSFLVDVVDGSGNVIGDAPGGGTLNTGLVLFPSKAIH
jgi:hypothetical protein